MYNNDRNDKTVGPCMLHLPIWQRQEAELLADESQSGKPTLQDQLGRGGEGGGGRAAKKPHISFPNVAARLPDVSDDLKS